MHELMKIHEKEKNDMVKIFDEAREILCECLTKKCKNETEILVEKAKADTRLEMKDELSKIIDDELANQQKIFEESMKKTLANIEANDRDKMNGLRNQCLKAMDVQHNLMICRQITELLQLMSVERRHWEGKLSELKDKYEAKISSLQSCPRFIQSKSIFAETILSTLDRINVDTLDEHEKRIFDEIQFLMAKNDSDSKIFIVAEKSACADDASQNSLDIIDENDWINREEDGNGLLRRSASVAVEWEKQSSRENFLSDDTFMSSIFNQMSTDGERQSSLPTLTSMPKIVSSIIGLMKQSNDDKLLGKSIRKILHNMGLKNSPSTFEDVIPMPTVRSNPVQIKDSIELINERNIE